MELLKYLKKLVGEFKEELGMFITLWKLVPKTERKDLLNELLFEPQDLRERFEEETRFQRNLKSGWRK